MLLKNLTKKSKSSNTGRTSTNFKFSLCLDLNPISEYTWKDCLDLARRHGRAMNFEKCAECCLAYLGRHLVPPSSDVVANAIMPRSLKVVFACGGNGSRWGRFMNTQKQLVNTGDGLSLIQRTINQFRSCMPTADFTILCKESTQERFKNISGASISLTIMDEETPVGIEILEGTLQNPGSDSDILWIYGDVYFSESAVSTIVSAVSGDCRYPKFFGRKHRNHKFGNTGGELFGVYAPMHQQSLLREYYDFIERLYIGFPLRRRSSWEVLALLGLMTKQRGRHIPRPYLVEDDAEKTYNELVKVFQAREFAPFTWIEIDDETEDFDYPCEYLERLLRTVVQVGITLDSRK